MAKKKVSKKFEQGLNENSSKPIVTSLMIGSQTDPFMIGSETGSRGDSNLLPMLVPPTTSDGPRHLLHRPPAHQEHLLDPHVRLLPRHDQPHHLHHLQRELQESFQEVLPLLHRGDRLGALK